MGRWTEMLVVSNVVLYMAVVPALAYTNTEPSIEPTYCRARLQTTTEAGLASSLPEKKQVAAVAQAVKKPVKTATLSDAAIFATLPVDTVLDKIAYCESSNIPTAKNAHSSAKGLLQIIDGTWAAFKCEGSVLNAADNIACGTKIATQSGLHHWSESRACWAPLVRGDMVAQNTQ